MPKEYNKGANSAAVSQIFSVSRQLQQRAVLHDGLGADVSSITFLAISWDTGCLGLGGRGEKQVPAG